MKALRITLAGLVLLLGVGALFVVYGAHETRARIDTFESRAMQAASTAPAFESPGAWSDLPAPVRRYFEFAFPTGVPEGLSHVSFEMKGQFRRPLTSEFNPTRARQVVSLRSPDMVFSADTPVFFRPLWAVAYDVYLNGEMEMRARLLSTLTVLDVAGDPALDRISLRRWLIESPVYPMVLLPGGPVTWQPIDGSHARATVTAHGQSASLRAVFNPDGSLARFEAEQDGDLDTPYHGSGEHAARRDYRLVQGVMVPMGFTIARAADGELFPFWDGEITGIAFSP